MDNLFINIFDLSKRSIVIIGEINFNLFTKLIKYANKIYITNINIDENFLNKLQNTIKTPEYPIFYHDMKNFLISSTQDLIKKTKNLPRLNLIILDNNLFLTHFNNPSMINLINNKIIQEHIILIHKNHNFDKVTPLFTSYHTFKENNKYIINSKTIFKGKMSTIIYYPEKRLIRKVFNKSSFKKLTPDMKSFRVGITECFNRELLCLNKLQKHKHFPKIISFDKNKLYIDMTYCGNNLSILTKTDIPSNYQSQIDNIMSLLKHYEMFYPFISHGNICIKNKIIYLIDFETCFIEPNITRRMEILKKHDFLLRACCNYDQIKHKILSYFNQIIYQS